jgi:hypothetical protein
VLRRLLVLVPLALLLAAAGALAATPKSGQPFLPPGPPGPRALQALGDRTALVELDRVRWREAVPALRLAGGSLVSRTLRVWALSADSARRIVPGLVSAGLVRRLEPVASRRRAHVAVAPDPLTPTQWWLPAVGADRQEPPGPGVSVTVVDSGVDATHPEFAGRPDLALLNEQVITGEGGDHGTAVASTAGAPANGVGVIGVYPQAVLRVWDLPDLSSASIVAALDAVAEGDPTVVNMSFGGAEPSQIEEEAILVAFGAGSVLVAAAGNEFREGNPVEYPASYNHVLTVAATDQANEPTFFSNANLAVDLAAPGEGIPVAVPAALDTDGTPDGFSVYAGTSFSAPIVAGAAAWVWTARSDLDNTQLFDLVRHSARDIGRPGFDLDTGFGLLDIPAALAEEAPSSDLQEPNDDVYQVKANGLFEQATRPVTRPGKPNATFEARLDITEDYEDVYRVWIPAGRTVAATVRGTGNVDAELWQPNTPSVFVEGRRRKRFLIDGSYAKGTRADVVTAANPGGRGAFVYLDVYLPRGGPGAAGYSVTIRTAKTRR